MTGRENRSGDSTEPAPDTNSRTAASQFTLAVSPALPAVVSSQQVSWWSVHEHVQPRLDAAGDWPMAGTPAWCALNDRDPVKLAALLDAARHWALRVETCQQAMAEASGDISAAADWPSIAKEIRQRREVYVPREVA